MTLTLKRPAPSATPIRAIDCAGLAAALAAAPAATRRWLETTGFAAKPQTHALVASADGSLQEVWVGVAGADDPWALSALPAQLPAGRYRLGAEGVALDPAAAAMSWALGAYAFVRYKPGRSAKAAPSGQSAGATLELAPTAAATHGQLLADTINGTRDLVNTPAEDMGPEQLAAAAQALARRYKAKCRVVVGDALLKKGFPAVHAVGRAATRAPRLIEVNWGSTKHPRLTVVGKGVCFDTGGLDIKGADGMRLMKKDMGGAANALGLAQLVMATGLPVRLQVLIPAVENAIAGNAYRPGDVIRTRSGLHIEIGNTDAEGRVILCDALAYGAESKPDLMIDLATLTGAARVALGPQLPALFSRNTGLARELVDRGLQLQDPLWHMPLWDDYHGNIESPIADIVNTGRNAMAGAVTAALFLQDFVPTSVEWLHIDLFAWNDAARPGRPVGGEAQTLRTLLDHLQRRYRR